MCTFTSDKVVGLFNLKQGKAVIAHHSDVAGSPKPSLRLNRPSALEILSTVYICNAGT